MSRSQASTIYPWVKAPRLSEVLKAPEVIKEVQKGTEVPFQTRETREEVVRSVEKPVPEEETKASHSVPVIEEQNQENSLGRTPTRTSLSQSHSLLPAHRRASYTASAPRPFLGLQSSASNIIPTDQDFEEAINDERALLEDNNMIPSPHVRRRGSQVSTQSATGPKRRISLPSFFISQQDDLPHDEESGPGTGPNETTYLLSTDATGLANDDDAAEIGQKWEDAVLAGKIHTTWQRELKTTFSEVPHAARSSSPSALLPLQSR